MCNIYFFHEQRQLLPSGLCVSNTTNFFFLFYFLWKLNKTFQIREINIPFHNAKWNLNCTKLSGSLVISVLLNRIWKAIGPVLAYRTFLVSTRKFSSHDQQQKKRRNFDVFWTCFFSRFCYNFANFGFDIGTMGEWGLHSDSEEWLYYS